MKVSEETLVSVGHRCGCCGGNGYFWREDGHGEHVKQPCPLCEGCGEVDAVIEIRWQASIHEGKATGSLDIPAVPEDGGEMTERENTNNQ